VKHYDVTTCSSKVIKKLRTVPLHEWFPLQREPRVDYFHTALQEDFHMTYVETQARFSAQRVISLKNFVSVLGGEF
jgi:hypothetical protein